MIKKRNFKKVLLLMSIAFLILILPLVKVVKGEDEFEKRKNEENIAKPNKVAYLTFDDGPSKNTHEIIQILNKYNIKAAFFVVGNVSEICPKYLIELKENGMPIYPHTYCHDYRKIYRSTEDYFNDLNKCMDVITSITGESNFKYVRMPGGSTNTVAQKSILKNIRKELKEKSIYCIDWNVSAEDAMGNKVPTERILRNVYKDMKDKDNVVILMHDSYYKTTTVEALPIIIEKLLKDGYTIKSLEDVTMQDIEDFKVLRIIR